MGRRPPPSNPEQTKGSSVATTWPYDPDAIRSLKDDVGDLYVSGSGTLAYTTPVGGGDFAAEFYIIRVLEREPAREWRLDDPQMSWVREQVAQQKLLEANERGHFRAVKPPAARRAAARSADVRDMGEADGGTPAGWGHPSPSNHLHTLTCYPRPFSRREPTEELTQALALLWRHVFEVATAVDDLPKIFALHLLQ